MEMTITDTLPEAESDWLQTYPTHNRPGKCRVRVYKDSANLTYIVCTDLDDENPGPSVTNAAESCQYQAWVAADRPIPVRFFEHYRGVAPESRRGQHDDVDAEHIDEVTFGWARPQCKVVGYGRSHWSEFAVIGAGPHWRPFSIERLKECIRV